MLTVTLFGVAAITGLRPTGETFNPNLVSETNHFNFTHASYATYFLDHKKTDSEEVSDIEHITFITLWLSHYVFCSSSLKVANKFVVMATQLHEGHNFCVSRLILGSLYESLGHGSHAMQKLEPGKGLIIFGPLWFFQLWLTITFESKLHLFIPKDYTEGVHR